MSNNLDDVINLCIERNLEVNDENKGLSVEFLQDQLKKHPEHKLDFVDDSVRDYKFPYVDLLADKLLIFSYLTRRKEVQINYYSLETTSLDSDDKLHLLKVVSPKTESWDDMNLFNLYTRRNKGYKKYGMQDYKQIIDEIGAHPKVVEMWGRELTYDKDVYFRQPKRIMR